MQRSFPVTPADLKRAVDPVLYRVIVNLVRCDVIIYIISSFLVNVVLIDCPFLTFQCCTRLQCIDVIIMCTMKVTITEEQCGIQCKASHFESESDFFSGYTLYR